MNKEFILEQKDILAPFDYEYYIKHLFDTGEIAKELYIELSSDLWARL